MSKQKFSSVWDAIEDTPGSAASMRARSGLLMALQEHLRASGMTQTEAAHLLGVTQPRVSDLMRGRIELFSLDALVDLLSRAGVQVRLTTKKAA
jgi:predicted XRE-type DNA-binding protein